MKWISEHIFTTSLTNKLHGVDTAEIEGIGSYLGRSPDVVNIKEKSAEAIVVGSNEPM